MSYLENLAKIQQIRNFNFPFIIAKVSLENGIKQIVLVAGPEFEKYFSKYKSYWIVNTLDFAGKKEWGYDMFDDIKVLASKYQLGNERGAPTYPLNRASEIEYIVLDELRKFNINYLKLNRCHN